MTFSSSERTRVAKLAAQLYGQVLTGREITLPQGAPQYLASLLQTAQAVLGPTVARDRRTEVYAMVSDLMSPAGFAGAMKQAESGARLIPRGDDLMLCPVALPGGLSTGVTFASGKNLMSDAFFQVAGIGRRKKSQAARRREIARLKRSGRGDQAPGHASAPGRAPLAMTAPSAQWNVTISGPLATLLRIVRAASR